MNIQNITDVDPAWDEFVAAHSEGRLYQLSGLGQVIARTFGHRPVYLKATRGAEIEGVLPLVHMKSRLFGNFLISVPFFNYGGVCAAGAEAEAGLLETAIKEAERCQAQHIELRHVTAHFQQLQSKSHKVCMLLDLPETSEALWKSFRSKLRSQIRKPEKQGITIRTGRHELLDHFYAVFAVNMRDLGTPVYSKKLFENVMAAFPERSWIVAAYRDDLPVAAGFLLGFRDTMEIPWASSLRKYNRLAANMLMYWHALKLSIEEGFRVFDFGRSTPGEGTYKFKAQWGARPVSLNWEYWMPNGGPLPDISPKNGKYQAIIRLWQNLPVPITRAIGPSIVKNIP